MSYNNYIKPHYMEETQCHKNRVKETLNKKNSISLQNKSPFQSQKKRDIKKVQLFQPISSNKQPKYQMEHPKERENYHKQQQQKYVYKVSSQKYNQIQVSPIMKQSSKQDKSLNFIPNRIDQKSQYQKSNQSNKESINLKFQKPQSQQPNKGQQKQSYLNNRLQIEDKKFKTTKYQNEKQFQQNPKNNYFNNTPVKKQKNIENNSNSKTKTQPKKPYNETIKNTIKKENDKGYDQQPKKKDQNYYQEQINALLNTEQKQPQNFDILYKQPQHNEQSNYSPQRTNFQLKQPQNNQKSNKSPINIEQKQQQSLNKDQINKSPINIEQQKQSQNKQQSNKSPINIEQKQQQPLNKDYLYKQTQHYEQSNKQQLSTIQNNKQKQEFLINFDQKRLEKTVEQARQLTKISSQMRKVDQIYSYYLQEYNDLTGLYSHYSIKQLQVKQNLKKYCQKILYVRGDGNCFYTSFGFSFLKLILLTYNDTQFNDFLSFIKEITIKFKIQYKNFKIDDDNIEQLLLDQFLYYLQQIRKIQNHEDRLNSLFQQYREFEIQDNGNGCFYFLSTIFFRNLSNQLLEYSDMKAYVEDRINLITWESECNNNEIIIATLAKYLKINIKLLFFKGGQFELRQYEEHLPNDIVLLIQPGHYNIGLKD